MSKQPEPRVAVVFIHGQGEQRPMQDVEQLARSVWMGDPKRNRGDGALPRVWRVPDASLGLADLGRVTTEAGQHHARVDFFELYWAHHMGDNRIEHFLDWFRRLQARPRKEAPRGLLPVRQWVIRFFESITVLSILFAILAALVTIPPATGLSRREVGDFFGLNYVVTPEDFVWLLAYAAIGVLGLALLWIIRNEIAEGRGPRTEPTSAKKLKHRARSRRLVWWWSVSILVLAFMAYVGVLVVQGPWLERGDLRLPILAFAFFSAWLLWRRKIEQAAMWGVVAGTLGVILGFLGGMDPNGLIAFSDRAVPQPLAWFEQRDATYVLKAEIVHAMMMGTLAIAAFAVLWFIAGLHASVGAARHVLTRFLAILFIVGVSAAFAYWFYLRGGQTAATSWAVFGLGVMVVATVAAAVMLAIVAKDSFLIPVMTDSARYFSREPEHISARQKIRAQGVELLQRLHEKAPGAGGYGRVVVVAHSLGTAVGYELLMDYWSRKAGALVIEPGGPLERAVDKVEAAASALNAALPHQREDALDAFRQAQRELSAVIATVPAAPKGQEPGSGPQPRHWLITDFITLGSPLTHASLLLADSPADLAKRFEERTLSACPPVLFDDHAQPVQPGQPGVMTFTGFDGNRRMTHASVFGAVRWTNHYFPVDDWIVSGDVIGGPLAPPIDADPRKAARAALGPIGRGVKDVPLDRLPTGQVFAHNEYWRTELSIDALRGQMALQEPEHINKLIEALDLNDIGVG